MQSEAGAGNRIPVSGSVFGNVNDFQVPFCECTRLVITVSLMRQGLGIVSQFQVPFLGM